MKVPHRGAGMLFKIIKITVRYIGDRDKERRAGEGKLDAFDQKAIDEILKAVGFCERIKWPTWSSWSHFFWERFIMKKELALIR